MRALAIVWGILTTAQRRRFLVLQFLSLVMAMSTVVGLAAVMTFLAVLADPTLLETNPAMRAMSRILGTSKRDFVVVLGGVFVAFLLASALLNVGGTRAIGRFAYSVGDRIRERLFADYLRRDYLFHARVKSGLLMDNVLNQAERVTITLLHAQQLMTNVVLTVLVVASIAVVNITVAVGGALAIAGSYLVLYRAIRRRISRHGRLQTQLGAERVAVVEQSLLGIKYLQIARAQHFFSARFAAVTRTLSHSFADTQFVGQFPKYLLEFMAGAGLIACAAILSGGSAGATWLAQLTFIGFAGFRLLPAFQQMYHASVIIRANRAAFEKLASELDGSQSLALVADSPWGVDVRAPLRSIELIGVRFRYAPDTTPVLHDATLRIAAGEAIGIIGTSGCGKTTLVDLILGLLVPTGGRVEIDGQVLDPQNVSAWQQSIGYVPQDVMILDASVRENIAFGVEAEKIDEARVREVAVQAGAGEFIEALPGGYEARLSGVIASLSGGQRQRIGVARALYGRPTLLVLDEATNALDSDTERAIVDTVVRNRAAQTLLIVAHGAAVIDACDRVYELWGGALRECRATQASTRVARLGRSSD